MERLGVRAIAQAPPKHDSASGGMVENALTLGDEMLRTLVIEPSGLLLGVKVKEGTMCEDANVDE